MTDKHRAEWAEFNDDGTVSLSYGDFMGHGHVPTGYADDVPAAIDIRGPDGEKDLSVLDRQLARYGYERSLPDPIDLDDYEVLAIRYVGSQSSSSSPRGRSPE